MKKNFILPGILIMIFLIILAWVPGGSAQEDSTPPSVIINSPLQQEYSTNSITIKFITDEPSSCAYSFDDLNWEQLPSSDKLIHSQDINLNNGQYNLIASCFDNAGNENYGLSVSFTVSFNGNSLPNSEGGVIFLDSCQVLSSPNTKYKLTSDILTAGKCFDITASGIILDGNGHSITGDKSSESYAIRIQDQTNVKIHSLFISGFDQGIVAERVEGLLLNHTNLISNMNSGIYISGSNNNVISGTAEGNSAGIQLVSGNSNLLDDFSASNNDRGILLVQSNQNTISNSRTSGNAFGTAIEIASASNIVKNLSSDSDLTAIAVSGPDNLLDTVNVINPVNDVIYFFDTTSSNNILKNITIINPSVASYSLRFSESAENYGPASAEGTTIIDSDIKKYLIPYPGGRLILNSSGFGSIQFLDSVFGSGNLFSEDYSIKFNNISIKNGLDARASIEFNNIPQANEYILLRNGEICPKDICSLKFPFDNGKISFNIKGSGDYFINLTGAGPQNSNNQEEEEKLEGAKNSSDNQEDPNNNSNFSSVNNSEIFPQIISPESREYSTGLITVKVISNESSQCSYSLNNETNISFSTEDNKTFTGNLSLPSGSHAILVFCSSINSSNSGNSSISFSVKIPVQTQGSSVINGNTGGSSSGGIVISRNNKSNIKTYVLEKIANSTSSHNEKLNNADIKNLSVSSDELSGIFSDGSTEDEEKSQTGRSPILTGDVIREVKLKDIRNRLVILVLSGTAIFLLIKGILLIKRKGMSL